MDRIEVNVQTGKRKTVQLTQVEIDANAAREATRKSEWAAGADDRATQAVDGQKILRALVGWIAPLVGKTPQEARQEIKAIYKGLP